MAQPEIPVNPTSGPPPGDLGYYRALLRKCVDRVSSTYQAKFDESDIVQETLAEAHASLGTFRGKSEAELAGWLQRILSRNLIDAVRRLRCRKRDVAAELRVQQERSGRKTSIQLLAEHTSPSRKAVLNEELQQMHAAIDRLPDGQRQAVLLHHLQGLSLAEVAAQMDRSPSAVAGLLHRGLQSLKESLGRSP